MDDELLDDPERVTVERVKAEVAEIRRLATDGEDRSAHDRESMLHLTVLAAIARGIIVGAVAQQCANEAAATVDVEFHRWPERGE